MVASRYCQLCGLQIEHSTCQWVQVEHHRWSTGCGHSYEFTDAEGGPHEYGLSYCGFCGGRLLVKRPHAREDTP